MGRRRPPAGRGGRPRRRGRRGPAVRCVGRGLARPHRARRARAAAGARRHPRARQRTRPHRVGGLRLGHAGGGPRRRDHDRRHAAELDPGDSGRRRPRGEAGERRGPRRGGRRVLGRRGPRERRSTRSAARCRGLRVQVLHRAERRRRVPAPRPGAAARGDRGGRRARRAAHRPRRGPGPPRAARDARQPLRRLPRHPSGPCRAVRRRAGPRRGADDGCPRARAPPVRRGGAPDDPGSQGRRRAGDRRDVSALPGVRGRVDPGRCDRVQVLPADPRRREPRRALGGAARRHDRLRRVGPLAVHSRPEDRRLGIGVGRDRRTPGGLPGGVDRGGAPGAAARDRPAVVHDRTRGGRRVHRPWPDRAGGGRAPRGPRPGGRARRRGVGPRPPQPGVRVRRPAHARGRHRDLAPRATRGDGRPRGHRRRRRPARPTGSVATRTKRAFQYSHHGTEAP